MDDRFLTRFWLRCEQPDPFVSADELQWIPPAEVEPLLRQGILREAASASNTVCEMCDDGHAAEIVWVQNAESGKLRPYAPCPEYGGAPIDPERLRRWAVDLDAIAAELRRQLNLTGPEATLAPGRLWALGRRHLANRWRDFFFVAGATRPDAHQVWDRCPQIEEAPSPVILVPAMAPAGFATPTIRLANLTTITDAGLTLDLEYLAASLPRDTRASAPKSITSFPVPEDATWDELKLTVREHSMLAEIRGARHEFGFEDLGMSGSGDRLWGLLCAFARLNGRLPGVSRDSKEIEPATFRKQVSDLRHLLSTVFPITGTPIPAVRGAGGYRTLFHISLDRRDGFPVQPERWDVCCFTELRDGRIAISVRTKEVFAARTRDGETQRLTATEAGERDGLRSEIYDLRTLGLGSESGRPTSEGRVFVALLRAGGKLYRRGDDKDILRLGERLRRWMAVDSGPFQFAPSRRLWTATFECGTEAER
jgi:hypothetical protein